MKNTIKENDILVCISDYMDNYRLMFEKGREYVVQQTEDYMWLTSEFIQGHELNENLLKYFKPKEMKKDSIVESVVNKFLERSKVGIEKYGTTLNDNNKDNFLSHLQEELMDAVNYIQKLQTQRKDNIQEKVIEWAKEKQLIKLGNAPKQLIKLSEEVGELGSAFLKNDYAEIKDAIGDIMIVLTILCEQLSIDMNQCYEDAYNVIKDRKGRTENGIFIRDENNDKENNS
jgi:NTP pyrophosphatase (non-canonical NTP hydrolase)